MSKRRGPALYEIIRSRTGDTPPPPAETGGREPASRLDEGYYSNWLQPGRQIAMPVGYLLAAIAGVMILMLGTFMFAYEQGRKAERIVHVDELDENHHSADGRAHRPEDPLRSPGFGRSGRDQSANSGGGSRSGSARGGSSRGHVAHSDPSGWGPIESDPREAGKWYFRIAETNRAGARRLAEFCRERGLETYVVPSNNDNLRLVIVLPGIDEPRNQDPNYRPLRELIVEIGQSWQSEERGASDLSDAYPTRYGRSRD